MDLEHRVSYGMEALRASPAVAWLGAQAADITVPHIISFLTMLLLTGQLIKLCLEFKDRRAAKRKESVCKVSESD